MKIIEQIKTGKKFISFIGLKTSAELISFLIPFFIAKTLSPDIFGSFSLFKMILFFGTAIFIGPIMAPFNIESNREYAKNKKSNETFTSALIYSLCSLSIFLLTFLLFGKELINFTGLNYEEYKIIFLLAFLGLTIKSFLATLFMSQDNIKANVFVEITYSIILIIYLLVIFYYGFFNLYNIFLGYFIASLVIIFVSIFLIDYKIIFPLKFSKNNFKTLTHFGFWVGLGYTSSYLINWGDNLALKYFVSLEEIGIYNFAYQIFKGFIMISLMINTYYTPFVAKNITEKRIMLEYYYSKRYAIIKGLVLLIILCNLIIFVVIDKYFNNYKDSITLLIILSTGIFCSIYYSFLIPIYNSVNKYKISQILLLIQVLMNLVLDVILGYFWGVYGVAVATSLAYIIFTVTYVLYFNKNIKPYYFDF